MLVLQVAVYGAGLLAGAIGGLLVSQQAMWLAVKLAHDRKKAKDPGTG